jgi:ribose-phosphate pyrophosphokinase
MEQEVKLLSGTNSYYLAKLIADSYGEPLGNVSIQKFSDGEIQPNILVSVRGAWVFCIQSTFAPTDNLMELLLMIDAAKRASADYVTAVIPYFGLARQDRKDKPRVPIGAKLLANLIEAAGANRIMTMDLHAPQIQGFFDIPVDHLDSSAVFIPYIEQLNLDNLIFAAPDVGSTKRIMPYVNYFDTQLVICDKQRKKANEIDQMTVIGDVEGKDVVIIDDICDTAGTLTKAGNMLKEKGAKTVRAFCTHPVLSGKAYETVEASLLEELVVTDTIPLHKQIDKIKVVSVADLFATAIHHTTEHKSISSLFINQ